MFPSRRGGWTECGADMQSFSPLNGMCNPGDAGRSCRVLVHFRGQARGLMAVMWKRWSGDLWLGWAFGLLCLALVSTFVALVSGFIHDPDDNPASYYLAGIPQRQWVMAVSVMIPAVSAAASGFSLLARPRNRFRTVAASMVLLLAVADIWFCWVIGIESIKTYEDFAKHFSNGSLQ